MEIRSFLTWLLVISSILGFGLGSMLWAYRGRGSQSLLFSEPVRLPDTESSTERITAPFILACQAFDLRNFPEAIAQFEQILRLAPTLAEAHHNCGLAKANLRNLDDAVAHLVQAGDCYMEQTKVEGMQLLKQHLLAMKAYKDRAAIK